MAIGTDHLELGRSNLVGICCGEKDDHKVEHSAIMEDEPQVQMCEEIL